MKTGSVSDRRAFLKTAGFILSASAFSGMPSLLRAQKAKEGKNEYISPVEDLMREHGVLRRILLVYEEVVRRIETHGTLPAKIVADASVIVRSFVENYHEKLEENYLFPRFNKAGKFTALVKGLLRQHKAGRRITDIITKSAPLQRTGGKKDRHKLARVMRQFIRMYKPHAAREDTVLFPVFRGILTSQEYDSLGEKFEREEDRLFGDEGFFKVVDTVAAIEKRLGIYDLAQFTPKVAS